AELGLPHTEVVYNQSRRERGITKNNFYTLYDLAMLGITNLSKVPLRLVTFSLGGAPLVLGLFFLGSVQLLCLGIIGEYVGSIHTFVQNRPLVIEKERINFPERPSS